MLRSNRLEIVCVFLAVATAAGCGEERGPLSGDGSPLQDLDIAPKFAVVAPGASRQFAPQFGWENGEGTPPPISFTVLGGGSITAGGIYTAPPEEGNARVVLGADGFEFRDTAEVTISSSAADLYPNQPAGHSRIAETNFSGVPALSGALGVVDGNFHTLRSPTSRIVVTSDATAPRSADGVLQIDFAAGTQPGFSAPSGYRLFTGWDGPDNLSNTEYSEIYESTHFKIVGTDFETNSVGVKMLGYWGVADNNGDPASSPGPVQLYGLFMNGHEGGPGTSLETRWNINMYTQGINSNAYPQNRNLTKRAEVGVWHHFETYMKLNTIGQANGVWRWWLDGVLLGEYTNMEFVNASRSAGFFGRTYDAVWGGSGGTAKARTDYLWLDHMYISGIFLRDAAP